MKYGELWQARFELIRPANVILAALAAVIGALISNLDLQFTTMAAAALATALITAFGNVINDIYDRDIDKLAHPERPLPSGRLPVNQAQSFAMLLVGFGMLEAYIAGGQTLAIFAGANALLLWLYAAKAKGWSFLGNVIVAYLVASAFIFGALSGIYEPWNNWGNLWGFALTAFVATLARELAKDAQDAAHDSNRKTLAQRIGELPTLMIASFLITVAVALTIPMALAAGPWWLEEPWGRSSPLRLGIAFAGLTMLAGLRSNPERMQSAMKWSMLVITISYGFYAVQLA